MILTHPTFQHGLRSEFATPMDADVLGFHEGFSDLVALLQHFSFPEVVEEDDARRR